MKINGAGKQRATSRELQWLSSTLAPTGLLICGVVIYECPKSAYTTAGFLQLLFTSVRLFISASFLLSKMQHTPPGEGAQTTHQSSSSNVEEITKGRNCFLLFVLYHTRNSFLIISRVTIQSEAFALQFHKYFPCLQFALVK